MSYTFQESNGIHLTVIKSSPNNIFLREINDNLCDSEYYGINGGFFDGATRNILSIAVNNDKPVRGNAGEYYGGWFNHVYARGTLVWDKSISKYSIQVVKSASDLKVQNRTQYWAQGGISMSLQDDANWRSIAETQNMPNMNGKTTRTALLWNSGFNIWLIITNTLCTAEEFRFAIKHQVGNGTLVDGIFLDGGGSTQMKCGEYVYRGDGRNVVQMVSLINK